MRCKQLKRITYSYCLFSSLRIDSKMENEIKTRIKKLSTKQDDISNMYNTIKEIITKQNFQLTIVSPDPIKKSYDVYDAVIKAHYSGRNKHIQFDLLD